MLGAFEQNAGRKGLHLQSNKNWELLSRDDIYRQRVLGADSGMKDFINLDDKRKLTRWQMLLYIIFLLLTIQFCWKRVSTTAAFAVNSAIEQSLATVPFDVTPVRRTFKDIRDLSDVKAWLLYAFPAFVTPVVQEQNLPVGTIRMTLRRMKQMNNTIERFSALSPQAWESADSIGATNPFPNRDETSEFGAYREWMPITDAGKGLTLNWQPEVSDRTCSGGELLDTIDQTGVLKETVQEVCKQWCELLVDPYPCRCFTISGNYQCKFYHMPLLQLYAEPRIDTDLENNAEPGLAPKEKEATGTTLHYPMMKRFRYQSRERTGYRNTYGYVLNVSYYQEHELIEHAVKSTPEVTPWTQGQWIANQVQDYVVGGMLSNSTAAFVIDFVTYNANYQMFSWVQFRFEVQGSGMVEASFLLNTLTITVKMIEDSKKENDMFSEFTVLNWLYFVMLLWHVVVEIWEMMSGSGCGYKYFKPGWNWLTMLSLSFQVSTLFSWAAYKSRMDFTRRLGELQDMPPDQTAQLTDQDTRKFDDQVFVYEAFKTISSFNLLFASIAVVHYMNDCVPRVKVLIDTLRHSLAPIIFLIVIVVAGFTGYLFWSYAMFGRGIGEFREMGESMSSNIQFLFGKIDAFYELRETFPLAGVLYFVSYMVIFFFIMQRLSTAVVLASYNDACEDYEKEQKEEMKRKTATEADTSNQDMLLRIFRYVSSKRIKGILPETPDDPANEQAQNEYLVHTRFPVKPAFIYFIFVCMYIAMTYIMTQIDLAYTMMQTTSTAVTRPTFSTVLPVSNKIYSGNNFSTVSTQSDVARFLVESLPYTMYNTSRGTFDGRDNDLLTYSSALSSGQTFKQLVINNWNIFVGQRPVRISTRYFKMKNATQSTGEIRGVIDGSTRVRAMDVTQDRMSPVEFDSYGRPTPAENFEEAKDVSEIDDELTRQVLRDRCNYTAAYGAENSTDYNGWACLLSVDRAETMEILEDMYEKNFVSEQTASIVVDFVLYNGYAEVFAYVAIVFGFQPHGTITNNLQVFTVRLDLYHDLLSWFRVLLEIGVGCFAAFYAFEAAVAMIKAGARKRSLGKQARSGNKRDRAQDIYLFFRGAFEHLFRNPFALLDLLSCAMTVVTFAFWYGYVLSALRENYYFQEFPTWSRGTCDAADWDWCSDEDVMRLFGQIVRKLRLFVRLLAINTVFVFVRALKYLVCFSKIKVIFNAFYRGLEDIAWFIVVLFMILFGYLAGMNQLFGSNISGLETIPNALRYCFEMFMGHFNYSELKSVASFSARVYFFSFQIIFKFMLFNMFLAIIDKNMQEEDDERHKAQEEMKRQRRLEAGQRDVTVPRSMLQRFLYFIRPQKPNSKHVGSEESAAMTEPSDSGSNGQNGHVATTTVAVVVQNTEKVEATAEQNGIGKTFEEKIVEQEISEDIVRIRNWHKLPQEMKSWAVEKAATIDKFVSDEAKRRENEQKKKGSQFSLEALLQRVETSIKDKRKKAYITATEVRKELERDQLSSLKEIHQDQESLSWYIMKRESELKKLETTKQEKQKRLEQMVQAAKSLICADDGDPNAQGSADALQAMGFEPADDRSGGGMLALGNGQSSLENDMSFLPS